MLRTITILLFLPFFLSSQDDAEPSLYTRIINTKFLEKSDSLYLRYRNDSAQKKIQEYSVEAAKVIYFNIADDDTVKLIKKDLQAKLDILKLLKKYKLVPDEDYMYAYVFKPLIIKEYYNKICFQSIVRLTRNDIVLDNTIENYKEITAGTYFTNQEDEGELEVVYFMEAYWPHQLPEIFADALYFYQTLTQSSEPLYTYGYRLRQEPVNKDLLLLDSLLLNYKPKPRALNYPVAKDSASILKQKQAEATYKAQYRTWDSMRYENFYKQTTKNKTLSLAFKNYSQFLIKYPVMEQGPVVALMYNRLHIDNRLFYGRHRFRAFQWLFETHGDSAIQNTNYTLFARNFFFTDTKRKKPYGDLISYKKQFYKDLNKIYLGQLFQTLIKSPALFEKQTYVTHYYLEENEFINSIKLLKSYLETKPKDELMMFYACSIYSTLVDELDKSTNINMEYEEWLEKYLEEFPLVKLWMEG